MTALVPYDATIQAAAAEWGVPANVLRGLILVESGGNPRAEHHDDDGSVDRGLVQINSQAHPEVSDAEAYDPGFAIGWAAAELAHLHALYGSWSAALQAYHTGSPTGDPAYARAVLAAGGPPEPGVDQTPIGLLALGVALGLVALVLLVW